MRKLRSAAVIVLCAALLAGCGSSAGERRGSYSEKEEKEEKKAEDEKDKEAAEEEKGQEEAEEEAAPTEAPDEPENGYENPNTYRKAMMEALDGTWELHEGNNYIDPPDFLPDVLKFDSASGTAEYTMAYAAESAYFDFELSDAYPEAPGQYNLLTLTGTGSTEDFPYDISGQTDNYLIVIATNGMWDTLFIAPTGNGMSQFSYETLGPERCTEEGFWVFVRNEYENTRVGYVGMGPESAQYRNGHFYGIRYLDYGSECSIQEIEPVFTELEMEDGSIESVLACKWKDCDYPFNTVPYQLKGREQAAHSPTYSPVLVEAVTDADGKITEMTEYHLFAYGYFKESMNGAPDAGRDPAVYEETDLMYIGAWLDANDEMSTLTISAADPQTGGYKLDFFIYRLCNIEAYANIDGDKLVINQGTVNDYQDIRGILETDGGGIKVTITESDFDYLPAGTEMDFISPD
ncbi:MAG: hypothetical protein IKI75_04560 [Lachnospiraceae bacterium]|nr:hypothetical protein [Lachnospiraceae bacterium]